MLFIYELSETSYSTTLILAPVVSIKPCHSRFRQQFKPDGVCGWFPYTAVSPIAINRLFVARYTTALPGY